MIIERTETEVIIRLSADVDTDDLQEFANFARFKELTANHSIDQNIVDDLASEINKNWWQNNRERVIK